MIIWAIDMGGGRGPPKLRHSLLVPHTPAQQEGIGTGQREATQFFNRLFVFFIFSYLSYFWFILQQLFKLQSTYRLYVVASTSTCKVNKPFFFKCTQ